MDLSRSYAEQADLDDAASRHLYGGQITDDLDFTALDASFLEFNSSTSIPSISYSSLWTIDDFGSDLLGSGMDFDLALTSDQILGQLADTMPASARDGGFSQNHAQSTSIPIKSSYLNVACPCLTFPNLTPDDHDKAMSEDFGHVGGDFEAVYALISEFFKTQLGYDQTLQGSRFIDIVALRGFVQLYYEYFDPQFPFVHPQLLKGTSTC